jgi:hypothetical protein
LLFVYPMTMTPPPLPADLPPIAYGTYLLNGIPVKQDSRAVIDRAYAGHPILIAADKDYVNLYHVFDRRNRKLPAGEQRCLVRQQIGPSRWRLFVVRNRDDVPPLALERHYDPKRGRYKRYAEQLANGDKLILHDKGEAIKARRAWQLYTPKEQRRHQRSSVRRIRSVKPTYMVQIMTRGV